MASAFSWLNYEPLPCFVLYSRAKFACYSRCFLNSYFCIPVSYDEKDIILVCQFQKVLQILTQLFNFSFFSISARGIDLDYCDIEWFALEMKRDHSVIFEIASKYKVHTGRNQTSCCLQQSGKVYILKNGINLTPARWQEAIMFLRQEFLGFLSRKMA